MTISVSSALFYSIPKTAGSRDVFLGSFSESRASGRFSVAVGDEESVLSREWAASLTDSFTQSDFPVEDSLGLLTSFLSDARGRWINSVRWNEMKWYIKNKSINGTYASFSGLMFQDDSDGIASGFTSNYEGVFFFDRNGERRQINHRKLNRMENTFFWSGYSPPLPLEYHWNYQGSFFYELELHPGDVAVICTPGLSEYVLSNFQVILRSQRSEVSPEQGIINMMRNGSLEKKDSVLSIIEFS